MIPDFDIKTKVYTWNKTEKTWQGELRETAKSKPSLNDTIDQIKNRIDAKNCSFDEIKIHKTLLSKIEAHSLASTKWYDRFFGGFFKRIREGNIKKKIDKTVQDLEDKASEIYKQQFAPPPVQAKATGMKKRAIVTPPHIPVTLTREQVQQQKENQAYLQREAQRIPAEETSEYWLEKENYEADKPSPAASTKQYLVWEKDYIARRRKGDHTVTEDDKYWLSNYQRTKEFSAQQKKANAKIEELMEAAQSQVVAEIVPPEISPQEAFIKQYLAETATKSPVTLLQKQDVKFLNEVKDLLDKKFIESPWQTELNEMKTAIEQFLQSPKK